MRFAEGYNASVTVQVYVYIPLSILFIRMASFCTLPGLLLGLAQLETLEVEVHLEKNLAQSPTQQFHTLYVLAGPQNKGTSRAWSLSLRTIAYQIVRR